MGFADDAAMQKKWKAFCRKIDTQTDDFSTVLRTIKVFLTEPFTAAVKGEEFSEKSGFTWGQRHLRYIKEHNGIITVFVGVIAFPFSFLFYNFHYFRH